MKRLGFTVFLGFLITGLFAQDMSDIEIKLNNDGTMTILDYKGIAKSITIYPAATAPAPASATPAPAAATPAPAAATPAPAAATPAPAAATPAPASATPAPAAATPAPAAATPAATATARPTVSVKSRDSYWIQAGAFSTQLMAEAARKTLAARGITAIIVTLNVDGQNFFRVRVGPYTSQSEAGYWFDQIKHIRGFENSLIWPNKPE